MDDMFAVGESATFYLFVRDLGRMAQLQIWESFDGFRGVSTRVGC